MSNDRINLTAVGSDPCDWDGTHIIFRASGPSPSGKTMCMDVLSKHGDFLGRVSWFSKWRKYCFWPADTCVFEETCLGEIAEYIRVRTHEHKVGV